MKIHSIDSWKVEMEEFQLRRFAAKPKAIGPMANLMQSAILNRPSDMPSEDLQLRKLNQSS